MVGSCCVPLGSPSAISQRHLDGAIDGACSTRLARWPAPQFGHAALAPTPPDSRAVAGEVDHRRRRRCRWWAHDDEHVAAGWARSGVPPPRAGVLAFAAVLVLSAALPQGVAPSAPKQASAVASKQRSRGASCAKQADCPIGQYCQAGLFHNNNCEPCSILTSTSSICDALGVGCCAPDFLKQCPSNPRDCDRCAAALQAACGAEHGDVFQCAQCAGTHQQQLQAVGCDNDAIAAWCAGIAPKPSPTPSLFPGSRIVPNGTWAGTLNGWMPPKAKGRHWALCYSSFTDDATTPKTFHAQCDHYNTTLIMVINSLGFTFGGYVRQPPVYVFG
eukprot:COSAG02_NODE_12324_length_1562_cov_1.622693_1_plen_330_part_01